MNRSLLQHLCNRIFGASPLPAPRRPRRPALGLEALPDRIAPAVTAPFSAPFGQFTVIGDAQDDVINNSQVAVRGGTPTVQDTNTILALALGGSGNDLLVSADAADILLAVNGETVMDGEQMTAVSTTADTDTDESTSARKRSTVKLDDITVVVELDKAST